MRPLPRIALIAARDQKGAIGKDGDLPWRLPDDLRHFKKRTLGCPVVMGRKTWESLPFPLPGRRNLVLTRQDTYPAEGAEVFQDVDALLQAIGDAEKVYVIGGGEIYRMFLPHADELDVTEVETEVSGADAFFPAVEGSEWQEDASEAHPADEKHAFAFTWRLLSRIRETG